MKSFKDFGITPTLKNFVGDKIKIDRIVNREIIVHEFRLQDSKFEKGHGKCLHLQIEINGTKHVVFTGSSVLMDMIQKVPQSEFPFKATIEKFNDHFEFK